MSFFAMSGKYCITNNWREYKDKIGNNFILKLKIDQIISSEKLRKLSSNLFK